MSVDSAIGALSADLVSGTAVLELASGIDALYLSGRVDLDKSFLADLDKAREAARAEDEPVPYRLGKVEFGLAPYGWGMYPFRLSHQHGLIGLTGSEHLPAVRVQPRAEMLHGLGPEATVDAFSDVLSTVGDVRWSVSRVDLFADVQGWWPTVEDRDRFVCRAKTRDTFEVSGELTGFQFGRRKGGGLSARVYEKAGQIEQTGADWWRDKWGDAYRDEHPVARVEFEFGRRVLRECGVDSPDDVFAKTAGLWGYATEWLSYRDRARDGTKSRWPVASSWEAIRTVALRDRPVTVQRATESRQAASERRIRDGLCGYLSSYAALKNLDTLGEVLQSAHSVLRVWELETGIPFSDRVAGKRRKWEWGL
jgi:hypothetical protein